MNKTTIFCLILTWLCVIFWEANPTVLGITAAASLGWIFGWNYKEIWKELTTW